MRLIPACNKLLVFIGDGVADLIWYRYAQYIMKTYM